MTKIGTPSTSDGPAPTATPTTIRAKPMARHGGAAEEVEDPDDHADRPGSRWSRSLRAYG